jgi:Zn-finger nucleic acid-binding protein
MRADLTLSLFVCDYCGSHVLPPSDDDGVLVLGQTKQKCPLCQTELSNGSMDSFELLYCARCRGMLIAMEDFQPLISALRSHRDGPSGFVSPRSSADADRKLPCPKCGAAMDNHPYGGGGNVNVDSCESCESIWLDRGELRKIAAAADYAALK